MVGWLCFLTFEKLPFVEVLCVPAVNPFWSPELYAALGLLLCGLLGSFCCGRVTTAGSLVDAAGPQSRWLPGLVCRLLAAGWWS